MSEEFKLNREKFLNIVLDEIFYEGLNLNKTEQKLLIEKFLDLYEDGIYDKKSEINIKTEIYEFIQGFIFYKLRKNQIMED